MTMPSELPEALNNAIDDARSKWGWFIALGVLLLIFGGVAFANLIVATVASVYFVGSLMLIGGVLQIFHAFGVKSWSSFFWWFLGGILYAVAGVLAFSNPLLASAVLTFLLAVSLIANGILRVWTGLKVKPSSGWGWLVAAGVITALAGLVIAMGWPVNSLWILGLFLAIDLIFQGWAFIAFGLALKAKG
ncbi:HdeD family acid-resistance protein [Mesorhizobium sp. SB112]|uniref:HdeD family acid-resistance protein n=1 Tax=Mesorhizobium sp. SB112 TaxID=3151853 RepID=UPI003263E4AB